MDLNKNNVTNLYHIFPSTTVPISPLLAASEFVVQPPGGASICAASAPPSHVDGQEQCVMLEWVLLVLRLSCENPLWQECKLLMEPLNCSD